MTYIKDGTDSGIQWINKKLEEVQSQNIALDNVVSNNPDPAHISSHQDASALAAIEQNKSGPLHINSDLANETSVGELANKEQGPPVIKEAPLLVTTGRGIRDATVYQGDLDFDNQAESADRISELSKQLKNASKEEVKNVPEQLGEILKGQRRESLQHQLTRASHLIDQGSFEGATALIQDIEGQVLGKDSPYKDDLEALKKFEDKIQKVKDRNEALLSRLDLHSSDLITQIEIDLKDAEKELQAASKQDLKQADSNLKKAKEKLQSLQATKKNTLPPEIENRFNHKLKVLDSDLMIAQADTKSQKQSMVQSGFEAFGEAIFPGSGIDVGPKQADQFVQGARGVGNYNHEIKPESISEALGSLLASVTPVGDARGAYDAKLAMNRIQAGEAKKGDYLEATLGTIGVLGMTASKIGKAVETVEGMGRLAKTANKAEDISPILRGLGRTADEFADNTAIQAKVARVKEAADNAAKIANQASQATGSELKKLGYRLDSAKDKLANELEQLARAMREADSVLSASTQGPKTNLGKQLAEEGIESTRVVPAIEGAVAKYKKEGATIPPIYRGRPGSPHVVRHETETANTITIPWRDSIAAAKTDSKITQLGKVDIQKVGGGTRSEVYSAQIGGRTVYLRPVESLSHNLSQTDAARKTYAASKFNQYLGLKTVPKAQKVVVNNRVMIMSEQAPGEILTDSAKQSLNPKSKSNTQVFEFVIGNDDAKSHNVMVNAKGDTQVFDHDRAFMPGMTDVKKVEFAYSFPEDYFQEAISAVKDFNAKDFETQFNGLLSKPEIDSVIFRMEVVRQDMISKRVLGSN